MLYPVRSAGYETETVTIELFSLARVDVLHRSGVDRISSDTPSRQLFLEQFLSRCNLVVYAYNATRRDTFEALRGWHALVRAQRPELTGMILCLGRNQESAVVLQEQEVRLAIQIGLTNEFQCTAMHEPVPRPEDYQQLVLSLGRLAIHRHEEQRGVRLQVNVPCPQGCRVRVRHRHVTSETEIYGLEESVVPLEEDDRPVQARMADGLDPTWVRALVPATTAPPPLPHQPAATGRRVAYTPPPAAAGRGQPPPRLREDTGLLGTQRADGTVEPPRQTWSAWASNMFGWMLSGGSGG